MMKKLIIIVVCSFLLMTVSSVSASVTTITIDGRACPSFAGQTSPIPTPSPWLPSDYFGDLSDPYTIPPFVDLSGYGMIKSITAVGEWGHGPSILSGPDGYSGFDPVLSQYLVFGISPVIDTPLNTLVGVFLTDAIPMPMSAPASLTYGVSDMTNPLLQQTFVIGSSLANIVVPAGATRLFLGLNDGYEWTNNVGSVDVTIAPIPAPGAIVLGSIGVGFVNWMHRRKTL